MTAYHAWTPPSRPGIIPLHPLTFGTILGRSFAALRHNPRVLLGFALVVQAVAYLLILAGAGGVAWASFSRLDGVSPGSDDFNTIMAGSVAVTAITGFVLGLAAGALGVVVQGVVVSEVARAAVAEKLPLRTLWRQVKPVAWRLVGYAFLLALGVAVLIAVVAGTLIALGLAALPLAVGLTVLVVIAAIPLSLWLSTKLLLAPAAIVIEHATIGQAVARSWRLVRGRFWPALGITVVVSLVFGAIAQVIGFPLSFLSGGLTSIFAPTGDPGPTAVVQAIAVALLTQVITLAVQSVSVIVQSTAAAIIYIDCRMRHEGLDLDLLAYIEQRDAGAPALPDPYRAHIGREVAPRPAYPIPYPGYAYPGSVYPAPPPGAPVPGGYGAPYAPPAYGAEQPPAYGQPAQPEYGAYPPPPYGQLAPPAYGAYAPPAYGPPPPYVAPTPPADDAPPQPTAADTEPPAPTRWTAPGAAPDGTDHGSR